MVGADLARLGAARRTDPDRVGGAAPVATAQAGAPALLRRRTLGPAPRRRDRAARRCRRSGVRARGAGRGGIGRGRALLPLPPHRGAPQWATDTRRAGTGVCSTW